VIAPAARAIDTRAMQARPHGVPRRHLPTPGDALLHPLVLVALAVLLLNDHYLKSVAPGLVTGKLSDFGGLALFPILLLGGWELVLCVSGRWQRPAVRALLVSVVATAVAFGLVKTVPPAADSFGWALSAAQWLLSLPVRLLLGASLPPVTQTVVTVDPTDLVALLALAVPLWVGFTRARTPWRARGAAAMAPAVTR
jgi:hypothetical protein